MRHSFVQSVVFPKSKFKMMEAIRWLASHDLKSSKVDETENTYRFRQQEPPSLRVGSSEPRLTGSRYYTKTLPNGVELVVAIIE